jgi:hypothetical protein
LEVSNETNENSTPNNNNSVRENRQNPTNPLAADKNSTRGSAPEKNPLAKSKLVSDEIQGRKKFYELEQFYKTIANDLLQDKGRKS